MQALNFNTGAAFISAAAGMKTYGPQQPANVSGSEIAWAGGARLVYLSVACMFPLPSPLGGQPLGTRQNVLTLHRAQGQLPAMLAFNTYGTPVPHAKHAGCNLLETAERSHAEPALVHRMVKRSSSLACNARQAEDIARLGPAVPGQPECFPSAGIPANWRGDHECGLRRIGEFIFRFLRSRVPES
ncbi:hypothetical protein Micbo1qcDRAFT_170281 [Microdochium bolleyi]|uniref:Uncharacterized protein n=1 Tax=Microdochium bolleyi TaxID=196109 RepID=A0A136JH15_9PEZI|nr:hypothetical protein Micbo1qcDRAFT_170281 [Microdochium bolleyi]